MFAIQGIAKLDVVHKVTHRPYTIAVPIGGHGSGLLVTADGLVLTARHVVEGARQVVVRVPGPSAARARGFTSNE